MEKIYDVVPAIFHIFFDKYQLDNCEIVVENCRDVIVVKKIVGKKEDNQNNRDENPRVHRDVLAEKRKEYYKSNREKILTKQKQKVVCECGSKFRWNEKARHYKSQKHLAYLKTKTPESV